MSRQPALTSEDPLRSANEIDNKMYMMSQPKERNSHVRSTVARHAPSRISGGGQQRYHCHPQIVEQEGEGLFLGECQGSGVSSTTSR
jgi:hypothetical protein